jgi:hypothetical protein
LISAAFEPSESSEIGQDGSSIRNLGKS